MKTEWILAPVNIGGDIAVRPATGCSDVLITITKTKCVIAVTKISAHVVESEL